MKTRSWIVITAPIALLARAPLACAPFTGGDPPAATPIDAAVEEAGADADADAGADDDGGEVDPVDPGGTPPPPVDGGCADAAFHESFGAQSFADLWSKTVSDGGSVAADGTYVVAPSSLRARLEPQLPSGFAFASRALCPSSGMVSCSFSLRIDASSSGDIGILDLRGSNAKGYAVARVKAREIMFLTPGAGGQRVDRAPVALDAMTTGAFHTVEVTIDATTYAIMVDGTPLATMLVPAAGLSLEAVRAGIIYSGATKASGWDVRIDELGCRFE